MKQNSWAFLFVLLVLTACGKAPVFEKSISFKDKEWSRDVKPKFIVDIKDIDKTYNFTLSIRTTTDYNYSNVWIFLKTIAPDGTSAREPFQIVLANPDGSWVGNKTGTIVETPLYFYKRKLPLKGKYTFIVEQGITESTLGEVLDVSFIVDTEKDTN